METPQSLAIESFSYSWLSQDEPPRTFVDIQEFSYVTDQNFKFDGIAPTAPAVFIHADELFTNGFIRPVYVDASNSKGEPCNNLDSIQTVLPSSPFSSTVEIRKKRNRCSFIRRCGNSTKQMLRNLYGNLRPLVGFLRKSSRVDDVDRRTWKAKSSPRASPQRSTTTRSVGDSTCHLENSIYEAVLHCKRSIGVFQEK